MFGLSFDFRKTNSESASLLSLSNSLPLVESLRCCAHTGAIVFSPKTSLQAGQNHVGEKSPVL